MKLKLKYYHYFILSLVLAVISLLIWYFIVYAQSAKGYQKYTTFISKRIDQEVLVSDKELETIANNLPDNKEDFSSMLQLKLKYPVYIFQNDTLVYWSENRFVPKYNSIEGNGKIKYLRLPIGKFLVNKKTVNSGLEIFSFITLSNEYSIENNYISSGLNEEIFTHETIEITNFHTVGNYAVYSPDNTYLFSLEFLSAKSIIGEYVLYLIIAFSIVSMLSLLIGVYYFINNLIRRGHIVAGTLLLLCILFLIRGLMLFIEYPYSLIEFKLFDSRYFASSEISPSLGDLFINIVFFSFFSWFVLNNYYKSGFVKKMITLRKKYGFIYAIILSITSILVLFYLSYIFSEIYSNSQFSLDITQSIKVNEFKVVSLLVFILTSGIYFIYNHIALRLYIALIGEKRSIKSFIPILLVSILSEILFILFWEGNWALIPVHFVYWVVLIYFSLPGNLGTLKYSTYLYFLLTAFVCSFTGSVDVYFVNSEKSIIEKHKYAFQLLNESDLFSEYLLNESMNAIARDKFIISRLKSIFATKDVIEQKIKKILLPDYLDKYEVHVSVFDSDGNVLVQKAEYTNYYEAYKEFGKDTFATEYENIYFLNERKNSPLKRYMAFREIKENGIPIGGVILELVHKKNTPNSVYPELLVDKKFITPQQYKNYQYAIYDKKLILSKGNFNYEKYFHKEVLENKKLFIEGLTIKGFHHLGIKSADGKVVIVSTEEYILKNTLSNFSFIFFLLLIFVLCFIAGYIYYFQSRSVHLNYATKILVYLNVAFFLPLFIVSIVTLSLISNYYKTSQNKSFIKKAESLSINILNHLESYQDDTYWESKLENDIAELAGFTDSDINLYNPKGELLYSYHPAIFDRNLLSRQLNIEAYISIKKGGASEIMLNESVGKLKYNAVYLPLKSSKTGDLLAILSIPFFESRQELNQQLIGIFTTTLNIFSIIFLVFAGLSYFASRILTSPLNIITQKIKKTTFGDNKPLDWNSKDEIGQLVGEYNSMLLKLEQSRLALSKNEKESAWREMAKQVAHEIKNPLTPMKLKIQHLQRSWKENNENVVLQTEVGLQSLLDQVNILNEIASSFSAFAKMPIPKTEHFDILEVLKSTLNLYNNNHDVHVDSKVEEGAFTVEGDGQLMGAIFTNLIINAIQAVPSERKPKVDISLSRSANNVVIEIKDNGAGISDTISENVFLPNFSTKETGSGIGLAVAKRGVEHAGGRIWFETKVGEGTSFFIEIPLVS